MRITSPARRAAGLLAVTTIGLSTAVLSVTGVASAELPIISYTTEVDEDGNYDHDNASSVPIPEGYCSVAWSVYGAGGGWDGSDGHGGDAGSIGVKTTVVAGQTYDLFPGSAGGDAKQAVTVLDDASTEDVDESLDSEPGEGGAGGTNDRDNNGAAGTQFLDGEFGGGGGAMSEVYLAGVRQISAFGGDGGGPGGGAGAGEANFVLADVEPTWNDSDASGNGSISADVLPCGSDVPPGGVDEEELVTGAPTARWVVGLEKGLRFSTVISTVSDEDPVTGVEYSLDGGAWTAVVDFENLGNYEYNGTINGLETGRTYSVRFRFTTAGGHTEPSEALTGAPRLPAPSGVKAAAGPSSIKVNWQALAGEPGVTGYTAWALPEQDQEHGDEPPSCETNAATALTCVIGVPAGARYRVVVMARDTQLGLWSEPAFTDVVEAVAVSATLPTSNGTLTSSDADGKVVAGEQVTISGKDFLPGSTVELVVYSTPVKLGTAVVLADGTFSATVTLPKELANGVHHLVATGVDVNGAVRNLVVEVTVSGGVATVTSSGLAYTGASPLPFVGAGVLALAVGGGLVFAARRRQAQA